MGAGPLEQKNDGSMAVSEFTGGYSEGFALADVSAFEEVLESPKKWNYECRVGEAKRRKTTGDDAKTTNGDERGHTPQEDELPAKGREREMMGDAIMSTASASSDGFRRLRRMRPPDPVTAEIERTAVPEEPDDDGQTSDGSDDDYKPSASEPSAHVSEHDDGPPDGGDDDDDPGHGGPGDDGDDGHGSSEDGDGGAAEQDSTPPDRQEQMEREATPEQKTRFKAIRRMHYNLAHPSRVTMLRMLRSAGAKRTAWNTQSVGNALCASGERETENGETGQGRESREVQ